jgi:predicted choloylglycine hydrolase
MKKAYKVFKEYRPVLDELDFIDPEIIEDMFGLSDKLEQEQLMALVAMIKNDVWMDNPLVFEDLSLIINGIAPDILEFEGSTPSQLWYSLFLMKKFRPDLSLGELVKGYVEFVHAEDGFYLYPKEAGIKTPLKEYLPQILELTNKEIFEDFNILDNQASKLVEAIAYVKSKIEEDGVY